MASPVVFKAPECLLCLRRITSSFRDVFQAQNHQQIRGKKRLAKVSTVKVHLLQNVPGYGRRGAVIPITAGMMRNIWYPKHMAEYLTPDKLQALGTKKDMTIERDSTFKTNEERRLDKERQRDAREQLAEAGAEAEREAERVSSLRALQPDAVVPIELQLLTPDRSMAILEELVPQNLDFHKQIISLSPPTPKRVSPSIPINATISVAAAGATKEPEIDLKRAPIYGSVTTVDITSKIKAILAENEDGERVVLSAEDISFVQELEEKDRVKHLGIFEIDIRLNGATDAIRRTIQVNAKE